MIKNRSAPETMSTIDLMSIDGNGDFPCPNCGALISPEDETEETYRIVDTRMNNNELSELVIECRACKNTLVLTGFLQMEAECPLQ